VFTLPLFPLRTVLFPGALLPLHIFESRYRELLAELAIRPTEERLFGLLPPGLDAELPEPGAVGTVARLRGIQQLADGRSNIVVSGERRFVFHSPAPAVTPYLQGTVEWFDDEPETRIPAEAEVLRLAGRASEAASALREAIELQRRKGNVVEEARAVAMLEVLGA